MDAERWKLVETLYHRMASQPVEQWQQAFDEACSGDPELREELKSLLDAREDAGDFLSDETRGEVLGLVAALAAPSVGDTLGPYRILAEAGAGAMGRVYRALDTRLQREVALKILPPDWIHDEDRVARFRLEAIAASALNHPNILTIHDIGQAGEISFIASEWIEGVTLRERMSQRHPTLEETLDIAMQCARALGAAHRAGIVHRDIKPENIMIRPDGLVKVVDFGLARSGSELTGHQHLAGVTQSGIIGTPRYMSPEQARGEKLDARTDIFSLGAVLYEMTHRQPAFPGDTTAEVFASLLNSDAVVGSGAGLDAIVQKALQKDRENRYATIDELADDLSKLCEAPRPKVFRRVAYVVVAAILAAVAALYVLWPKLPPLSDKDRILLADFVNQTGDQVFDLTLKQGLAVQLDQSPLLDILSEESLQETLRLMRQPLDKPITATIAREVCQRQGLKAFVTGAIAPIGSHYVITLTAVDSQSGSTLARAQAEAAAKEQVLRALSRAASELREQLGESAPSLRKFDALPDVTTSSIEALRVYSLGRREAVKGNNLEAIRFLRRAIELDPNFAAAYRSLASAYVNAREPGLASEFAAKAYDLREHASERERLTIIDEYYGRVTGELDRRIETLRLYQNTYPRDPAPYNNLAVAYNALGRFDEAIQQSRVAIRFEPPAGNRWTVLGNSLMGLGRFDEAGEAFQQAIAKGRVSPSPHQGLFRVAFVKGDEPGMRREVQWADQGSAQNNALDWQSAAAAFHGQYSRSQQFTRRISESVAGSDAAGAAAGMIAQSAVRAAALGRCVDAKGNGRRALSLARDPLSLTRSALALAWCGQSGESTALIDELIRQYPLNTVVNRIWVPVIRAASALQRGDDESVEDGLRSVIPYEAAAEFWPLYLRGQAWLHLKKPVEAEAEFHKILDHRGQDPISPLYPLAKLGLARAAALRSDVALSQKLYGEFMADWKDADRDLPALVESLRAVSGQKAGFSN